MTNADEFLVWNFDTTQSDKLLKDNEMLINIPKYLHVKKVTVNRNSGHNFLHCSCGFYDRIGIPCHHVFCVTNAMSAEMFHVRFWKIFNVYYGEQNDVGECVSDAQQWHFDNEYLGVPVSDTVLKNSREYFCGEDPGKTRFPVLLENTTEKDYAEAKFVLSRNLCCTNRCFNEEFTSDNNEAIPTEQEQSPYESSRFNTHIHLTKSVNDLHAMADESVNKNRLADNEEKQLIRKNIICDIDSVMKSESMTLADLQTFCGEVEELVTKKLANAVGRPTKCAFHQESYGSSDKETDGSKNMFCETLEVGGGKYKFAAEKGTVIDVGPRMKSGGTL